MKFWIELNDLLLFIVLQQQQRFFSPHDKPTALAKRTYAHGTNYTYLLPISFCQIELSLSLPYQWLHLLEHFSGKWFSVYLQLKGFSLMCECWCLLPPVSPLCQRAKIRWAHGIFTGVSYDLKISIFFLNGKNKHCSKTTQLMIEATKHSTVKKRTEGFPCQKQVKFYCELPLIEKNLFHTQIRRTEFVRKFTFVQCRKKINLSRQQVTIKIQFLDLKWKWRWKSESKEDGFDTK